MAESQRLEITGGAGAYEAAAIMAIIARITEEESATLAQRPRRPRPPAWVRSYQGFHIDDPLPVIRPEAHGGGFG
ncbi:MAG: hypothetical protein Q8Q52_04340, partial [Acidimicrobiia bacterium]|nr:hypothetical protein [Acidimicrobiia bacterium]